MKHCTLISVVLWLLLGGCEPSDLYLESQDFEYTFQLRTGIIMQNQDTAEISLLRVNPRTSAAGVTRSVLFTPAKGDYIAMKFAGHNAKNSSALYVVTGAADARRTDARPTLHVINTANNRIVKYPLSNIFSAFRFSPDGQSLILYHGNTDARHGSLNNPNEIAIVDLTAPPAGTTDGVTPTAVANPRSLAVDIKGNTIENIHFLDPVPFEAGQLELVAFVAEGIIQFTDFKSKTLPGVTVSLKNESDTRQIVAQKFEVIPGSATHGPRVFVQATQATELYDIEFNPKDNVTGFYATTSLLDGGTMPSDFAVLEDKDELFVVSTATNAARINIFEASTARVTGLNVDYYLDYVIPRDNNGRTELVMYGDGGNRIYFLSEEDLKSGMGDNLAYLNISKTLHSAKMLDNDRMMIFPRQTDGLVIVDLNTRTLTHLAGQGSSASEDNVLHNNTLFLKDEYKVDFLNILNGTTGNVALDEAISEFYVFPVQGIALATHNTPTGRVTTFPLAAPDRAHCKVFDGFLISGVLNEGEE